jgi:selenocysteine lyase/cysteine desulfurase
MNLEKIRNDTAGTQSVIHLNNAGAALMPRVVAEAIRTYIDDEERQGGYETAEKRREELDQFYEYAAQLLSCQPRNTAFTTNATDSYNKALSSVPFKQNDVILTTANDYASNFIALLSLEKRLGTKTILVRNEDTGEINLDDLEEKTRKYSPKLLSVTHVPTSSGLVQPVEQVGEILAPYDTLYLLDACQSLGQMRVDAFQTKADFISGTLRKFLRGPRGAGLLYVSDKALDRGLEPLFPDLWGAEWIAEREYLARVDARRFEDWETAYALMLGSKEALAYLASVGIDAIEARNAELTARLKTGLAGIPRIRLLDRGKKQCSIITFSLEGAGEQDTKAYFREKGINISTMPKSNAMIDFQEKGVDWAVRASPHYYNTEGEIDRFVEAVKTFRL